jgi:hypothetical protein
VSAVLHNLTGFGSSWAQDPPHYAHVLDFETGAELDRSRTAIENWRGWSHLREVRFYHEGPIVVLDHASGPRQSRAAISWQLTDLAEQQGDGRILLRGTPERVEMVLVPLDESCALPEPQKVGSGRALLYEPEEGGELRLVTVLLDGDWVGSRVSVETDPSGERTLYIRSDASEIAITPIDPPTQR